MIKLEPGSCGSLRDHRMTALDADLLLCHVLQKNRTFLITHPEYALNQTEQDRFSSLMARHLQGEPIAYLVGSRGFWKHDFKVTPAVLIPRPETELLIELILQLDLPENPCIIDLGTGSGCIAISLALEYPDAQIFAVDKSKKAIEIAKENAKKLHADHITFIESHWCHALPAMKADIIVSNPPYLRPEDPHLTALSYEPKSALVAPSQGLGDISQIAESARDFLRPGGALLIEHGFDQEKKSPRYF